MKKSIKLLSLSTLLFTITSCSSYLPSYLTNQEINDLAKSNNEIVLNVTSIGLLDGEKGDKLPTYFLENSFIYTTLSVGDDLPSNVTSTNSNAKFVSWVYDGGEGEIISTLTVVKDINYYQAYFDVVDNPSLPSTPSTPSTPEQDTSTIYFLDKGWWNKDAASSSIQTSSMSNFEMMTYVEGTKLASGEYRNIWSYTLSEDVTSFHIVRTGGSTLTHWGAETVEINVSSIKGNLIILQDTEAWSGNGNYASVTYSTYTKGVFEY